MRAVCACSRMTDSYITKELEWDGGDWGEDVFYHPYMAPEKMENSVIDFDIQNLQALLKEKTNFPVDKIVKRVNSHYLDASRLIKRAFGNKIADDFQMYNWGLTLTMDLGLAVDKLELLLNVYAKKLPRRITRADFDYILDKHSTLRHIPSKHKRKLKWMDLVASFKIHSVRKPGLPDTVGKRQMVTIMDVNEIDLDLDVLRITKDMRRADVYANKLHMLLLDDPLISGNFQEALAAGKLDTAQIGATGERLRDFEARVNAEEEEFGPLVQKAVDEKMRQEFEAKEVEDRRRAAARKAREDARLEAKRKEEEEKQVARDRLDQIRREREEWERRKAEKAIQDAAAERTRLEREKELAERQRREREAEEQRRQSLATEAAAAAEEMARLGREQLEAERAASVGMFDHLSGEERVRAEAAHKLAEHRRIKAIERKRLLEETRLYAESQLARRGAGASGAGGTGASWGARDPESAVAAASAGAGEIHVPTLPAGATPKKRRDIEDARMAKTKSKSKGVAGRIATRALEKEKTQEESSGPGPRLELEGEVAVDGGVEDLPAPDSPARPRPPVPATAAATATNVTGRRLPGAKRRTQSQSRSRSRSRSPDRAAPPSAEDSALADQRRLDELIALELLELDEESRQQRRAEEEQKRLEAVRAKLRRAENERIMFIEAQDAARRTAQEDAQLRRHAEEETLQQRLAVQAKTKADKEARLAEAAVLRRHAEEHRLAAQQALEAKARQEASISRGPNEKSASQLALEAKEEANRKARAEREAKQRATRDRARKLQEDAEAKRAALAGVIEARHSAAKGARQKRGGTAQRERLHLDAAELWPEGGAAFDERQGLELSDMEEAAVHASSATERRGSLGSVSMLTVSDYVPDADEDYEADADDEAILEAQSATEAAAAEAAAEAVALAAAEAEAEAAAALVAAAAQAEAEALAAAHYAAMATVVSEEFCTDLVQSEGGVLIASAVSLAVDEFKDEARRQKLQEADERMRAALEAREQAREGAQAAREREEADERARLQAIAAEEARLEAKRIALELVEAEAAAETEQRRMQEEEMLIVGAIQAARLSGERKAEEERLAAVRAEEELRDAAEAEVRRQREAREAIEAAERAETEASTARAAELVRQMEEEERVAAEAEATEAAERKSKADAIALRKLQQQREQEEQTRLEAEAQEEAERLEREEHAADEAELERQRLEIAAAQLAALLAEQAAAAEKARLAEIEALSSLVAQELCVELCESESAALFPAVAAAAMAEELDAAALSVTEDQASPGKFRRPSLLPSLSAQRLLPADVLVIDVAKSADGTLRLNIRCDEDAASGVRGLFMHGFKANSAAEQQGLLRVGDELMAVGESGLEGESASLAALVAALKGLRGPTVRMVVRRPRANTAQAAIAADGSDKNPQVAEPTAPESPTARFDALPAYTIVEGPEVVKDALTAPLLLEELQSFPAVDLDINVPLSEDGKLRLYIRHDDEGDAHGLFIHGFKPNSAAEMQGLLRPGDELITVAGRDVKGCFLEDVVEAMLNHVGPEVAMTVRRHLVDESDPMVQERAEMEIEAKRVAVEAMLDEIERQQGADGEDTKENSRRKKEQVERLMLEQKRQRELRIVREAEERRKKAASMPNSLMDTEASAAYVKKIAPFEDLEVAVPKTQGELRVHVKHSKRRGLFIHGFKPNSLAEQQGILCVGDELLAVEGEDVRAKALPGLVAVLKNHTGDAVRIKLRRHKYNGVEL